jgi:hypothetical protein
MRKIRKSPDRSGGFSLIELVIVSSLLVLVSLAVFSVFSAGLKIYCRAQSYEGKRADILIFLEKAERELRNTFNYSGINFTGDARKISFPGIVKKIGTDGAEDLVVSRITYYFDPSGSAMVKERTVFSNINAPRGSGAGMPEVKEELPASYVKFSYCYFKADGKDYSWTDVADGGMAPAAVKIEAAFKDDNKEIRLVRTVLIPVSG